MEVDTSGGMDVRTILICNSKGGVGKSLIADELAFSFERSKTPFNFYDLDSQGGTLHKAKTDKRAAVAVVDTPGALTEKLGEWMSQADLVIVPTRCTSRDIDPLLRIRQAVMANTKAPALYVLNCWTRYRAARDFREWLAGQVGDAPILTLPQSEQFVQAGAFGVSVVEYAPQSAAAKDTLKLCNAVRELVGLPTE